MDFLTEIQDKSLSLSRLYNNTNQQIIRNMIANKSFEGIENLALLLSPAASVFLEDLAYHANKISLEKNGKIITLFAPVYISNECINTCTYCGLSLGNKIKRKTLNEQELSLELDYLFNKGFRHILLVAGEHHRIINKDYVNSCLNLCSKFHSVSIELAPFDVCDYTSFVNNGVNGLYVYQETYDKKIYQDVHLKGKKRNFDWRLHSVERGALAGMRNIGLGVLLGLNKKWELDLLSLGSHLSYMMKKFWKVKYSVSIPRICNSEGNFSSYGISDKKFVQVMIAFRLCFPDINLVMSTREKASLRNGLIRLGVTHMSAESATEPGGYNNPGEQLKQFETTDNRSLEEVEKSIKQYNYEVVLKDWEKILIGN